MESLSFKITKNMPRKLNICQIKCTSNSYVAWPASLIYMKYD